MQIVSLNIGKIQHYNWRNGTYSAINKTPVLTDIELTTSGLLGNEQADKENHAGEEKALLVIPTSNYRFFEIEQPFGFLGENISLDKIEDSQIQIGDRLKIGNVILEVSQPRSPCWKLGQIMESQLFVKKYSATGRVGFYCRVIQTGKLTQGQAVILQKTNQASVSIQALFVSQFNRHKTDNDWKNIQTAINHPALSQAWLSKLTKLAKKAQHD